MAAVLVLFTLYNHLNYQGTITIVHALNGLNDYTTI